MNSRQLASNGNAKTTPSAVPRKPSEIALKRLQATYREGIPARIVVGAYRDIGAAFTEATFRKYVQAGLLPKSWRVGRKGKHQGSRGLYPVEALGRVATIRSLMARGYTIEDLKDAFVVRNHLDQFERELDRALEAIASASSATPKEQQKRLQKRAVSIKARARALVEETMRLATQSTERFARLEFPSGES